MEEWLQVFDPLVQNAIGAASRLVARRGGEALSIEDVLLVLLEPDYPLSAFLRRHGVDLDQLVRAIQCEQPIVSVPSEAGHLSRELTHWLARTREGADGVPGLADLMRTLVSGCDRLGERAYVTLLEQIADRHWRDFATDCAFRAYPQSHREACEPLETVVEAAWPASEEGFAQARRLAALVSAAPSPLLHVPAVSPVQSRGLVSCAAGTYAECFETPVASWRVPVAGLCRGGGRIVNALRDLIDPSCRSLNWFFLDNATPHLLMALIEREGIVDWASLAADPSVLLILSHAPLGASDEATARICAQLGRPRAALSMPPVTAADVLGYCQTMQPMLEDAIGMPIETAALRLAVLASGAPASGVMGMSSRDWLEQDADFDKAQTLIRAAGAMVRSELALGPERLAVLRARERMSEQSEMLSLARGETSDSCLMDADASLEKAATEVTWLEQYREGRPVLDRAAMMRWLESRDPVSSSTSGFWYDARCLSDVTRE